jgi:ankyrin repeat protein
MRRTLVITLAVCVVVACGGPSDLGPSPSPALSGGIVHTDLRLHSAATAGDLPALEALIAAGAALDARDADGRTAVMAATIARQADAVRALLDAGADVDIRDDRLDNPFLYAGAEGLLDILRLANEAGADPAITNRFGGIALIPAAERGHVEVVRYLLTESDVDVDHVNNLGWTALLEAIILSDGGRAHQEIVALLIEHGADVDLADRDGVTPLAHARARGYDAIAALLAAEGAQE